MQVDEYKTNEYENSDYKPEVEKVVQHPEETTIEFVDLRKEPKIESKSLTKKLIKDFFKAFGLKVLFKLAKLMDKSKISMITSATSMNFYEIFSEAILNFTNIRYGLFIVIIKVLFKLFRKLLYYLKLQDVVEYKRFNFLFGLLTNFILIPLASKSPLFFYTCVFFLFKSLFFFMKKHIYGIKKRVYSESKEFYYIGLSLGFIIMSLISNEYRNNIRIVKYFI
jgi:hypothetical protein